MIKKQEKGKNGYAFMRHMPSIVMTIANCGSLNPVC